MTKFSITTYAHIDIDLKNLYCKCGAKIRDGNSALVNAVFYYCPKCDDERIRIEFP